ncbi:MAG: hypothetical protein ABGW97_05710 [Christiangramia sp.]|uniref:hypothetical protein n=1 Tax=Christiangramia sp. TaxID=1931228 RepID=UPI0032422A76
MKKILYSMILGIALVSCKNEQKNEPVVEDANTKEYQKIAEANGFKEFDDVEKIGFTFNVKVGDSVRSKRHWVWNRKAGKISLTENDSVSSYVKKDSLGDSEKSIDSKFINDSYWLLFPFQMEWSNAKISDPKEATAPISGDQMKMLTVSFPSEGGYTPGDSYDIYYDDDLMIQEWVYKSADGGREMATTWEDYKNYDGIKIAQSHKNKEGNFELFFTDIEVTKSKSE